jgi:hypothetical protein
MDSATAQKEHGQVLMSLENVQQVLSFLQRSQLNVFSIIGGEPTTHPEFQTIVNMALEQDFMIFLFTNAICRESVASFIGSLPDDRIGILVNTNAPEAYTEREYARLTHSLFQFGMKASLGFNVYEPQFDLLPLVDLIKRHQNKPMIRIGLTQPILGKQNTHIPLQQYPQVGERLVEQAEACDQHDVQIGLDCGFPLCMFTHEQLGKLYTFRAELSFECRPVLDVGPNLECWACFPLSPWERVNILDFENVAALNEHFKQRQLLYHRSGLYKECFSCRYIERGQCKGGCLSHIIAEYE